MRLHTLAASCLLSTALLTPGLVFAPSAQAAIAVIDTVQQERQERREGRREGRREDRLQNRDTQQDARGDRREDRREGRRERREERGDQRRDQRPPQQDRERGRDQDNRREERREGRREDRREQRWEQDLRDQRWERDHRDPRWDDRRDRRDDARHDRHRDPRWDDRRDRRDRYDYRDQRRWGHDDRRHGHGYRYSPPPRRVIHYHVDRRPDYGRNWRYHDSYRRYNSSSFYYTDQFCRPEGDALIAGALIGALLGGVAGDGDGGALLAGGLIGAGLGAALNDCDRGQYRYGLQTAFITDQPYYWANPYSGVRGVVRAGDWHRWGPRQCRWGDAEIFLPNGQITYDRVRMCQDGYGRWEVARRQ